MIAGRLTMRALLERNVAVAKDAWGQPVAADFQPVGDPLPCFVYSNSSSQIEDGQKVAPIEELRIMVALGADLRDDDEISGITDRSGTQTIVGRLKVMGPVQRKHNHLEATLRRIG